VIYISDLEHQAAGAWLRFQQFHRYRLTEREADAGIFAFQTIIRLIVSVTIPWEGSDGNETIGAGFIQPDEKAEMRDATDPAR